jgi:hypothetical protein
MLDPVMIQADELRERFGEAALRKAEALLDAATAGRDHRAGIFYADVCNELRDFAPHSIRWTANWGKMFPSLRSGRAQARAFAPRSGTVYGG